MNDNSEQTVRVDEPLKPRDREGRRLFTGDCVHWPAPTSPLFKIERLYVDHITKKQKALLIGADGEGCAVSCSACTRVPRTGQVYLDAEGNDVQVGDALESDLGGGRILVGRVYALGVDLVTHRAFGIITIRIGMMDILGNQVFLDQSAKRDRGSSLQ